jgi:penicillin amidase
MALDRARAPGADPALAALATTRVVEAVGRLDRWDCTTPTGIREGYDAADANGVTVEPTAQEISSSVTATLYSVWRGQFIRNTIDAAIGSLPKPGAQLAVTALRHLLDSFPVMQGAGLSGVNFFVAPPAAAVDRRDYLVLKSLSDALDRLSGAPFEAAFGRSTDQADYRWGKLHRIVFAHPLGGPFSIPPAGGALPAPLAGLPGLPTDGGYGAPDASNHNPRAQGVNDFMYASGPVNRFVAEAGVPGVRAESVWPGGTSGVIGSPYYANLLPRYLTNDTVPLLIRQGDLQGNLASVTSFVPGP